MSGRPEAWASYWREAGPASGCAPAAKGIAAACARIRRAFAQDLPPHASVLDLATGNGAVLLQLAAVRPDAVLTGIDSAPDLGGRTAGGFLLKAGVAMEQLPFAPASFSAVTSQFGFEYGDTGAVSAEAARVLRPGGALRLLIHHQDSPVVAQGLRRADELRWALGPESPLQRAVEMLASGWIAGALPVPPALGKAPQEAAALFPGGTAAGEIMAAMLQMLERGGRATPLLLRQLREKVEAELARLEALSRAARGEAAIAGIADELAAAGLSVGPAATVAEDLSGMVFAWLLDGRRI